MLPICFYLCASFLQAPTVVFLFPSLLPVPDHHLHDSKSLYLFYLESIMLLLEHCLINTVTFVDSDDLVF